MRRSRQQLTRAVCEEILRNGTSGVLSLVDEEGAPYGVPLSYVWTGEAIAFHGAAVGMKMDCLAHEARASFCVISADEVVGERYTTAYESVIVRGTVEVLSDESEKARLAVMLGEKYFPGHREAAEKETRDALGRLKVFVLHPTEITGKEGLERQRGRKPA